MPTSEEKYQAGATALQRVRLTQPAVAQQIITTWLQAGGAYAAPVKTAVAKVTNSADRSAIGVMLADKGAATLLFKAGIGGALESVGGSVADAGGVVGEMPTGVTGAVTDGLQTAVQEIAALFKGVASANFWVRVGQVVLGVLLITVAAAKLMGPSAVLPGPVNRVAKVLR